MINFFKPSNQLHADKGRPDYYITPSHDFRQYTRDCEEKYWNRETAFDWSQNVRENLKKHLESLDPEELSQIALMTLPMVLEKINQKIDLIKQNLTLIDEDALKDIEECIPFDKEAIKHAISAQSPLKEFKKTPSILKDRIEILERELFDLKEQKRLEVFSNGASVKHLETEHEIQIQNEAIIRLTQQIKKLRKEYQQHKVKYKTKERELTARIQNELEPFRDQILNDLQDTQKILLNIPASKALPQEGTELERLKDLIWKRQIRGLKDLANHALVVEQSAIAPLSMGIIHYKRHREIQEAMTTFINDEAKHSATFRRFLVEKLEAKEYINSTLIKGANRYLWLSRFMPGTGMFLAVIVEAIGAAYLEFFGTEKYMPDKLFCSICQTISLQDEKRHMDLCAAMYNELYRKGSKWEQTRNKIALKVMMKAVYGDKTENHHLIQAFRAFGVESSFLYNHIINRLSQQLSRIGLKVKPEEILKFIG